LVDFLHFCIDKYTSIEFIYPKPVEEVIEGLEVTETSNKRLANLLNRAKEYHKGVHQKLRESILERGLKTIEQFKLPLLRLFICPFH
jgi:hypothetical protein